MAGSQTERSIQHPRKTTPYEAILAAMYTKGFGGRHKCCCRNAHREGWWCWLSDELKLLKKRREEDIPCQEICKEFLVKDVNGKLLFQRHHSAACLKEALKRGW